MSIVLRKLVSPQDHQQEAAGQLGKQVPQLKERQRRAKCSESFPL